MLATRLIPGALMLAAILGGTSIPARADCPLIPIPNASKPQHDGKTPKAPTQVKDMTREHFQNSQNEGASYCLYSPPSGGPVHGLIMYLHGYHVEVGAHDPMLQFLAKAGFYIVYPYYPLLTKALIAGAREDGPYYPTRARTALSNALSMLKGERNVDIRHVAVAGHSFGAAAAVRVAATWTRSPAISAIVLHDPSDAAAACQFAADKARCANEWDYTVQPFTNIPCSTRLLVIQSQTEYYKGFGAQVMENWQNLRHIAKFVGASGATPQRNFLRVPSDASHSRIATLESNLLAPMVIEPGNCRVLNLALKRGLQGRLWLPSDLDG